MDVFKNVMFLLVINHLEHYILYRVYFMGYTFFIKFLLLLQHNLDSHCY